MIGNMSGSPVVTVSQGIRTDRERSDVSLVLEKEFPDARARTDWLLSGRARGRTGRSPRGGGVRRGALEPECQGFAQTQENAVRRRKALRRVSAGEGAGGESRSRAAAAAAPGGR